MIAAQTTQTAQGIQRQKREGCSSTGRSLS